VKDTQLSNPDVRAAYTASSCSLCVASEKARKAVDSLLATCYRDLSALLGLRGLFAGKEDAKSVRGNSLCVVIIEKIESCMPT